MSASDLDTTIDIRTPCCDAGEKLAWRSWQHAGYPRKADLRFAYWNLRCPSCGEPLSVAFEIRLRRANEGLGWHTLGRPVGAPIWLDRS